MKYVDIRLENGETWRLLVAYIAHERAKYYEEHGHNYMTEFLYLMEDVDEYDTFDWLRNNTDWSNIKDYVTLVETKVPTVNYNDMFTSAKLKGGELK